MPDGDSITLREAARLYLESLSADARATERAEVERFTRWAGADRLLAEVRGHDVANYGETLAGNITDVEARAGALKGFFAYAKKSGLVESNLGAHLRLKKSQAGKGVRRTAIKEVEMSGEEHAALTQELEALKAQRPQIVDDIRRAMADKDFRENAPLDAAKQRQGLVEARIRELEAKLAHAVIVGNEAKGDGHAVEIGSTVRLVNLKSGSQTAYTLVRPGEVNPSEGRISFESPVGRALLQRRAGDEVEVTTPSGSIAFRIEAVEG
jgi:transcription elongation factor GreA